MQLHSERITAPSPAPAPPHLKCPPSTLRFQLSPAPTLWQSPAQGQGRPGPREMLRRKRNKHEGDKEGQALQPSQLGTARAAASSRLSHCWGDMHRSRHQVLRPAHGANMLDKGTEGTLPRALRPGPASLSDPANPSPTKPRGAGYSRVSRTWQGWHGKGWYRQNIYRSIHTEAAASTHLSRHLPGRHECWTSPAASALVPPSFPTS